MTVSEERHVNWWVCSCGVLAQKDSQGRKRGDLGCRWQLLSAFLSQALYLQDLPKGKTARPSPAAQLGPLPPVASQSFLISPIQDGKLCRD